MLCGGQGRLGRVLVGRGGRGVCMHVGCSTVGWPAERRQMRAGEGVLVRGVELGSIRVAGGSSRTWLLLGWALVWNMMAWGWHVHANAS